MNELPVPAPMRLTALFRLILVMYSPAAMLIESPGAEPSMQACRVVLQGATPG